MEVWADIKGFEGHYQVSSYGRIKSVQRQAPSKNGFTHTIQESIRKPVYNKGCKAHAVILMWGKKRKHHLISFLVAQAFVDNPNNLPKLIHLDGDKSNNRASNLGYVDNSTQPSKIQPSKRHYKLTESDINDIKTRRSNNEVYRTIAADYNVSITTVFHICNALS